MNSVATLKHLYADIYSRSAYAVALICNVCAIVLLFLFSSQLPSEVPLYYSLPWGSERLAQTPWMLIIPGAGFIILLINAIVAAYLFSREVIASRMLSTTAAFVSFLGVYTMIRIIFLIT